MRNIIIIGSGGHSRSVISIVRQYGKWIDMSIIDIRYSGGEETILGIPIVGDIGILDTINTHDTDIFVAIGDNRLRKDMINLVVDRGFKIPNLIHSSAIIDESVDLGFGNFIGAGANLGPDVRIGNGNIVNTLSNLDHESRLGNYSHLSPSTVVCGRSVIGDLTWLGANSTVIDGVEIADETTIGAGAVVIRSISESGLTYTGIPAKRL